MERIEISNIVPGLRFSKPVFFDDGKNMFIEAGITIKPYHISALSKWKIPFLLSNGHIMKEGEVLPEEPLEENVPDLLECLELAEEPVELLEEI